MSSLSAGIRIERRLLGSVALTVADYPPGLFQSRHEHAVASRAFVLRGELEETARGAVHRARAGEEVVKPAEVAHSDRFGRDGARLVALEMPEGIGIGQNSAYAWSHDLKRFGRVLALARAALRSSEESLELEERALELLDPPDLREDEARAEPRRAPSWVATIRARIAEDPTVQSVRTFAHELGVHPVHVARLFRRCTGMTLRAWRRRVRVERAIALLPSRRGSLAAVALAAGFADQSHLCRAVRAELGITPTEVASLLGMGVAPIPGPVQDDS